jgi:D-alanyl-D-alanine carboxypeptidase
MTSASRLALVASLVLAACSHAASGTAAPASPLAQPAPTSLAAQIDSLAEDALAHNPVAGFSITVVSHGQVVVSRGYGVIDVDKKTPAAADSIFRIGSITKQFTAAAILQLAAAGKLSIDDKLSRFLPDFKYAGQITLHQLLTHTSGLKEYTSLPWWNEHMADSFTRAELLARIAAEPLDFAPGTRWSYCNSGYYLLGLVIEKASGQSYADYVKQHVVAKAGLADTGYCPPQQDYSRAARGYQVKGAKLEPAAPIDMAHPYAAGSLCSTTPDLVAWMKALAHGQIVDEAAWTRMTTPVTLAGGKTYPYGFGLFTADLGGHAQIGHGGGINGFVSALSYFPDDDLYVAVLVDTESGLADSLAASIARTALGVKEKPLDDLPIRAPEAAKLVGRYNFPDVGLVVVISVEGDEVYARNEGRDEKRRLHLQADGSYVIPEAHAVLKFELDGDHAKSLDVTQGGVSFTGARLP